MGDRLNEVSGETFTSSRLLQDPTGLDYIIKNVPKEGQKRKVYERYKQLIQKKIEQINDAKIDAGIEFEQTDSTGDMATEIERLKKSIAEKEAALGQ